MRWHSGRGRARVRSPYLGSMQKNGLLCVARGFEACGTFPIGRGRSGVWTTAASCAWRGDMAHPSHRPGRGKLHRPREGLRRSSGLFSLKRFFALLLESLRTPTVSGSKLKLRGAHGVVIHSCLYELEIDRRFR